MRECFSLKIAQCVYRLVLHVLIGINLGLLIWFSLSPLNFNPSKIRFFGQFFADNLFRVQRRR